MSDDPIIDPISAWNAWESQRYEKHPWVDDAGTGVENIDNELSTTEEEEDTDETP